MDNARTRVYWHANATARGSAAANRVTHTRNLGWLLRNAAHVTVLSLSRHTEGARLAADGQRNGQLFTFVCDFADYGIAQRWLARPCLRHAYIVR
jgi:hypothetical protein